MQKKSQRNKSPDNKLNYVLPTALQTIFKEKVLPLLSSTQVISGKESLREKTLSLSQHSFQFWKEIVTENLKSHDS